MIKDMIQADKTMADQLRRIEAHYGVSQTTTRPSRNFQASSQATSIHLLSR